jgi:predicted PurR-regulated permease PerM
MPTDSDYRRRFLWILFTVASALVALVIWPFAGSFFAAAVLAAVLVPWQQRLAVRLGDRPHLAAALVTLLGLVALVIPLGVLGFLAAREGQRLAAWTSDTLERKGVDGLVEPLPDPLESVARSLIARLPQGVLGDASAAADRVSASEDSKGEAEGEAGAPVPAATDAPLEAAAGAATEMLGAIAGFLVRVGVLLVATFFFLSEGERLIEYVVKLVPLEEQRTRAMLSMFREVAVGVFLSTVATAAAQTIAALIGYLIAGVPGLPVLLFATFVISFVPAVGGGGTVAAVGLGLCLSGRVGMGLFLIAYGFGVVGVIDNVVKPLVAKDHAKLPSSVVFFAMICGLAVFGPMGLVAGPLILAFFRSVVRMMREDGTLVGGTQVGGKPRARARGRAG